MRNLVLLVLMVLGMSSAFAAPNAIQKIKTPVLSCTDPRFAQYLQFENADKDGAAYMGMHLGMDTGKGYFNVSTNMDEIMPIDPNSQTQVYKVAFTGNKAVITGALESVSNSSITTLCSLALSCECAGKGCEAWVETIGSGCNIAGSGIEEDPFIIQLKK